VLDGFYELRPYIRAWQQEQFRRARRYGMVWDAIGRTRLIPQMRSQLRWLHSEGEREAANMPIQSGATASIKLSMAMLYDKIRELETRYRTILVRPLLQIHDEIMTEVKEEFVEEWREIQKPLMENSIPLRVPVLSSFKAADNWAELK
jgi:DNA polymerase I